MSGFLGLRVYQNKKASRKTDGTVTGGVRRRPSNDAFDPNAPSWKDTLEVLYMVRNNIMHGTKSFDGDDVEIIKSAYSTLHGFIVKSECYAWENLTA
jgi:hypothetical protein